MSEVNKPCQLCGSNGPHEIVPVREMYFGTREVFDYFVCAECGTLQIAKVLEGEELMRFYPSDYYSYKVAPQPKLFQWLTAQEDRHDLRAGGRLVGTLVSALPPGLRGLIGTHDASGDVVKMLGELGVSLDARVLDVGCGGGALLDRLARAGFTNLFGNDPFIEADGKTALGVPLAKRDLDEMTGEFDVILFNHSLEHVPDLTATLKAAHERLAPTGFCLVRVPTTSSEVWDTYRANWMNIDAPKHICIPSRKGMAVAADRAGLRLEKAIDDQSSGSFIGSEANRRDIALTEMTSLGAIIRMFGLRQVLDWERRAVALNRQGRGDQTGFVLRVK
ncbi:class I SAM-dependent methyltransferase [Mycobacterium sp. ACS4054]|uniref:class I SAM-dependent methyltransferase n=1 Tax=Mycobacterium sp. ACS4054 TaxID=1834119 RepID=UPI0035127168